MKSNIYNFIHNKIYNTTHISIPTTLFTKQKHSKVSLRMHIFAVKVMFSSAFNTYYGI